MPIWLDIIDLGLHKSLWLFTASPIPCLLSVGEPVPFAEIFQSRAPIHGHSCPHRSSEKPSVYPMLEVSLVMSFLSIIIEWNLPHYWREISGLEPCFFLCSEHPLPLEKSLYEVLWAQTITLLEQTLPMGRGCVLEETSEFPLLLSTLLPGLDSSFQTSAELPILILLWITLC